MLLVGQVVILAEDIVQQQHQLARTHCLQQVKLFLKHARFQLFPGLTIVTDILMMTPQLDFCFGTFPTKSGHNALD